MSSSSESGESYYTALEEQPSVSQDSESDQPDDVEIPSPARSNVTWPNPYDSLSDDEPDLILNSKPGSIPYNPPKSPHFGFGNKSPFWDPAYSFSQQKPIPVQTSTESDEALYRTLNQNLESERQRRWAMLAELGLEEDSRSVRLKSVFGHPSSDHQPLYEKWETLDPDPRCDVTDPYGDWPTRLLHVPSMTSLQWQPGNRYGSYETPRYTALSYTWGRWEIPDNQTSPPPSLGVQGTTWKIPRIAEALFTVADFERVIKTMTQEARCDFVWLDVACIDQNKDSAQGAREIGRQVKIFRTAYQTFIWLTSTESTVQYASTQNLLQTLLAATDLIRPTYHEILDKHVVQNSGLEIESLLTDQTRKPDVFQQIANAASCISTLSRMPWFTSLWTLQEAFLRPVAMFIDSKGNMIKSAHGDPLVLDDVLRCCDILHQLCNLIYPSENLEKAKGAALIMKNGLKRVIERSGLEALAKRNPMALYTCAKSRQTLRTLDRVYGIMQVWGFQLGKSAPGADPLRRWSLAELEVELGKRLLQEFPIESQLHVHTSSVPGRQSWRISNSSTIPYHPLSFLSSGHLGGQVSKQPFEFGCRRANGITYGCFRGNVCPLDELRWALKVMDQALPRPVELKEPGTSSLVRLALDWTVVINKFTLQIPYALHDIPEGEQHRVLAKLSDICGELGRRIFVLLLGSVKQYFTLNVETAVGIIVIDVPDPVIGKWWKRLGICLWTSALIESPDASSEVQHATQILNGKSAPWYTDRGLFG